MPEDPNVCLLMSPNQRQEHSVANSYFSTVFEQSAGQVWSAIRDFGEYQWAGTHATRASMAVGQSIALMRMDRAR
jgi:hypothetical protein